MRRIDWLAAGIAVVLTAAASAQQHRLTLQPKPRWNSLYEKELHQPATVSGKDLTVEEAAAAITRQTGVPVLLDATDWPAARLTKKATLEVKGHFRDAVSALLHNYDCSYTFRNGRLYLWAMPDLESLFSRLAIQARKQDDPNRNLEPAPLPYHELENLKAALRGKSIRIAELPGDLRAPLLDRIMKQVRSTAGPYSPNEYWERLHKAGARLTTQEDGRRMIEFRYDGTTPAGVQENFITSYPVTDLPRPPAAPSTKPYEPPAPPAGAVPPAADEPVLAADRLLQKEVVLAEARRRPLAEVLEAVSKETGVTLRLGAAVQMKQYRLSAPELRVPAHHLLRDLGFLYGLAWQPDGDGFRAEPAQPEDTFADDLRRMGEPVAALFHWHQQKPRARTALQENRALLDRLEKGVANLLALDPAQQKLIDDCLNVAHGQSVWGRLSNLADPMEGVIAFPEIEGPVTVVYLVGGASGSFSVPPPRRLRL